MNSAWTTKILKKNKGGKCQWGLMSSKMLIRNAQWPRILSAHRFVRYNLTLGALDLTSTLARYPPLSNFLKSLCLIFSHDLGRKRDIYFFFHKGAVQSSPRASGTAERPSVPLINAKLPNDKSADSSSAHTQDNFKTLIIIVPSTEQNCMTWLAKQFPTDSSQNKNEFFSFPT